MLEAVKGRFTIVVVGSWNVAIFSPAWIGKNILNTNTVTLEVGVEPGLPRRLTAEDVTVIPRGSRIMVTPANTSNATLERMEDAVCRIMELLNHTPVSGVGVNFGYEVKPLPSHLSSDIPVLLAQKLASEGLVVQSREIKWTVGYDKERKTVLNLSVDIQRDLAIIGFNFHSDVRTIEEAIECVRGKVIAHRDRTAGVLENVLGLRSEG